MAEFTVVDSRRLGLDRCEFDISDVVGELRPRDLFQFLERGTLWEYVILDVVGTANVSTLHCITWVPSDGAFVGFKTSSRPMKAIERKRYAKVLPA
jgi:hypothetical protein